MPIKSHSWDYPSTARQRLHIDYASPFLGQFLIVVNAFSEWSETVPMNSANSLNTIKALMRIFPTHGIPGQIASDNGTQFTSNEFQTFCKANKTKHTFNATYHPATNGRAERFVQTFMSNMKRR